VTQESFGHLAARGIAGAEEQQALALAHAACSASERSGISQANRAAAASAPAN
jgi:hypothetical protein